MKSLIAYLSLSLLNVALRADDTLAWPQFRGPGGSGVADDQQPPVEIGTDKNVRWKVPAPGGLSSPIVAGDNLILTAFDHGKLYTIAYRRADGQEAWRAEAPAKAIEPYHKQEGGPASSTAVTDGERIVSYFGSCGLFCHDLTGKELWRHELPPVKLPGEFGSGVSPILADGTVVLVRDQMQESKIVALDARTGAPKWERSRLSPVSYCTPVAWKTPAGTQVVAAGHARMVAYDLRSGDEAWSLVGIPSACCSTPVTDGDVLYFAGGSGSANDEEFEFPPFDAMLKDLDTDKDGALARAEAEKAFEGFFDNQDANKDGRITRDEWEAVQKLMAEGKNAAFALRAGGTGDVSDAVLWKQTKGLPYVPSAILYRGQYVMVKDGGIVTAFDAKTGDQVYMQRGVEGGRYYASPVAANGNLYFTSLEDGVVTVIRAGLDKPEQVVQNPPLGERVAATPAIADDALYVRTEGHLYAFGEK
jgi:outer membrane protein assembly factor BamB